MNGAFDTPMDRQTFLKRMLQAGLCCGAAFGLSLQGRAVQAQAEARASDPAVASPDGPPPTDPPQPWVHDLERRLIKGSESPGWVKAEKAEAWIKALMDHLDEQLPPEARIKLMQACGRSCYLRAFGVASERQATPEDLARYLKFLEDGGIELTREDDTVSFTYSWGRDHQNPWGLIIRDGYCMCPLVESGPPGLSPTYCYCSTGYVKELEERLTGRPVKVDLVESLKTGGRDCVFRITVL